MELQYIAIVLRCCDANMYRAQFSGIELAVTVLLQKKIAIATAHVSTTRSANA